MKRGLDTDAVRRASENLLERETNYREALRLLLDWQGERKDHLIALPARMGTSRSYLASVSLGWIAANVYLARDLPLFKDHRRKNSGTIDSGDTIVAYLRQRAPDYTRQLPMTMYLATREHHKFPPLLLAACQDWVYDQGHDNWGPDGRALESSLNVERLDTRSHVVDMDVASTSYFVLDGQHRLLAIRGLKELLENGRLNARRRDGTMIAGRDMAFDEMDLDSGKLQDAMNEVIGVEIIPAVQNRETFRESVSRLRNVFADVSEGARRPKKGGPTLLDESGGFGILARTIVARHPLFMNGPGFGLNSETKGDRISEDSTNYVTIDTVVSIARRYLGEKPGFEEWGNSVLGRKGKRGMGSLRPADDGIGRGLEQLSEYFDALAMLPSHESMIAYFRSGGAKGRSPAEFRAGNDRNILFRPIAQTALARSIARLQGERNADLRDLIGILSRHEKSGDLGLTSRRSPWFGILCDPAEGKVRRRGKYEDLCAEMFVYLLGGGFEDDEQRREKLRNDFFDARRSTTGSSEPVAYDMSGRPKTKDEFFLPEPWR